MSARVFQPEYLGAEIGVRNFLNMVSDILDEMYNIEKQLLKKVKIVPRMTFHDNNRSYAHSTLLLRAES